jgi:hypothetical protein
LSGNPSIEDDFSKPRRFTLRSKFAATAALS